MNERHSIEIVKLVIHDVSKLMLFICLTLFGYASKFAWLRIKDCFLVAINKHMPITEARN